MNCIMEYFKTFSLWGLCLNFLPIKWQKVFLRDRYSQ